MHKVEDNRLETYRQICAAITAEIDDEGKILVLRQFFENGSDQCGFKGDLMLWVKLLLPKIAVATPHSKISKKLLLQHFARLLKLDDAVATVNLANDYDATEYIVKLYEEAGDKKNLQKTSTLYLQDAENFLNKLDAATNTEEQYKLIEKFCSKLTTHDLRTVVRLMLGEDSVNLTARHVLDAIAIMAYPAYISSRNFDAVVRDFGSKIMKSVQERLSMAQRKHYFWQICGFSVTFMSVYAIMLFLRNNFIAG